MYICFIDTMFVFNFRQVLRRHEPVYQALWAGPCDFDEVLISPVMIQDHMPDNMLKALNKVSHSPMAVSEAKKSHNSVSRSSSIKPGLYEPLEDTVDDAPEVLREETNEGRDFETVIPIDDFKDNCCLIKSNSFDHRVHPENNKTLIVVDVEIHKRKGAEPLSV